MIGALKKINKKLLALIGLIFLLPIGIIIFLLIIQGCGDKHISFEKYEEKMISAAKKYINNLDDVTIGEGKLIEINLSTLVDKGYIKSTEKLLGDNSCRGMVTVRHNGVSIDNNGGYLDYIANLKCNNYSTKKLVDMLKEQLVTAESGLYEAQGNYIFKGKNVKNYVNFYGNMYVILEIVDNNVLKLLKVEPELNKRVWDNKYNVDANRYIGKNIYKDSLILEYLLSDYMNDKKFSTEAKQHIVARDVCIGKRSSNDYSLYNENDCADVLENQVVSLLNITDYAKASLDIDCNSLNSRSCTNYNYLSNIISSTWTLNASSDNSYDILYLMQGIMSVQEASKYEEYHIVIYIDGNQLYTSGSGTEADPFVIGKNE